MKNQLIYVQLLALGLCSMSAQAQCEVDIPPGTIEISSDTITGGGAQHFLVCDGAQITISSGLHKVYANTGARVDVHGGSPTIYVRSMAQINILSGTPRIIHHDSELLRWEKPQSRPRTSECEPIFTSDSDFKCLYKEPELILTTDTLTDSLTIETDSLLAVLPKQNDTLKKNRKRIPERLKGALQGEADSLAVLSLKIDDTAVAVGGNTEMTVFKNSIHIKEGRTVLTGEKNRIYLEPGVELVIYGGQNIIFAKNGSKITLSGAESNKINHEKGVEIIVEQDGSKVEIRQKGTIQF